MASFSVFQYRFNDIIKKLEMERERERGRERGDRNLIFLFFSSLSLFLSFLSRSRSIVFGMVECLAVFGMDRFRASDVESVLTRCYLSDKTRILIRAL